MSPLATRRKAIAFLGVMGAASLLGEAVRPRRHARSGPPLVLESVFPRAFDDWTLDASSPSMVQPPQENGRIYGIYDQVIQRAYRNGEGEQVMLCVAYGSDQSPALQVHRPEGCYAANGFRIGDEHAVVLKAGTRELPAVRLLAVKPGRSEPITYWTALGDAIVTDRSQFTWRQLASGLGGELQDGMLVRLSCLDRDRARAWRLHARFLQALAPAIAEPARSRVFGAVPAHAA